MKLWRECVFIEIRRFYIAILSKKVQARKTDHVTEILDKEYGIRCGIWNLGCKRGKLVFIEMCFESRVAH